MRHIRFRRGVGLYALIYRGLPDSLELLRTFYSEGLVDNRTFLTWLVQQTGTCNLAQLALVACLADQYLDGMLINRALTHHFVDACLNRVEEARHVRPQSDGRQY